MVAYAITFNVLPYSTKAIDHALTIVWAYMLMAVYDRVFLLVVQAQE